MIKKRLIETHFPIIEKSWSDSTDWVQPFCLTILGIMGIFFIYSAQSYGGGTQWVRQIVHLFIGVGAYVAFSLINYKLLLQNAHYIYYGCIILLLLLWTPLGQERFNSLRWLDFKFITFQPSETAKIGVLIMVSSILSRSEIGSVRESLSVLGKVLVFVIIPILLIFLQPDLGSALVIPPMVFSLLYVSKLSERFFAGAFAVFLLMIGILALDLTRYHSFLVDNNLLAIESQGQYEEQSWIPLKDYQRNRLLSFIAPEAKAIDPQGTGVSWNYRQSLISVGSGGFTGKGWLNGTQAKLGYLPQTVAHNDFIFSVLAEEKGFLGSLLVLSLFAVIVGNGIRIAGLASDRFGMFMATGVSIIFLVHIFINIGMTIGLMPITGLPLPFLSYGGSFILGCSILQGILQSIYRYRRDFS